MNTSGKENVQPIKKNARFALYDRRHFRGPLGTRKGYRYLVWDGRYGDVYFWETIPQALRFMGEELNGLSG